MTLHELEVLANNGDAMAMNNLAVHLENMADQIGMQELRSDLVMRQAGTTPPRIEYQQSAISWWDKAARLGNGNAKFSLAVEYSDEKKNDLYRAWERMYGVSMGVTYDKAKAAELFQEVLKASDVDDATKAQAQKLIKERRLPSSSSGSSGSSGSKGGGCYIATSVYGSYDCSEVLTLRRFRDNTLCQYWYGRLFIRTYYAISPKIVKIFGNKQWFVNLCKPLIDRVVANLQNEEGGS